jgi:hypothetical protein
VVTDGGREVLLRDFLDTLDEVEAAGEALQEDWRGYRRLVQHARRHFEAGGSVPGLIGGRQSAVVRTAKAPVHRLEEARIRAQQALFRLAAADGMNAADIGRAWDVSRQFVSRVLNDSADSS